MMSPGAFVVLIALGLTTVAVPAHAVTPVQKVIEMLTEMAAKGQKEKEMEAKVYEEYAEWVDDQTTTTGFEIKTAEDLNAKLIAEIEKAESDVSELDGQISELDGEIATWEKDQKTATELRTAESNENQKTEADYTESLDALDRAIAVLKSQSGSVSQAAALLEESAVTAPRTRQALAVLLEERSSRREEQPSGAPEVAAYESQSGGIIEMLKKLKKKFKQELNDLQTAEANAAHNFDLEMLHLGDNIQNAKNNRDEKAELRAGLSTQAAEKKGELADSKFSLAEDQKYLADLKSTFKAKTAAFEENQKVRAEEIKALQEAIKIISSPGVQGSAEKHLPTLLQKVSLLQLGTAAQRNSRLQRAAAFLGRRAKTLSSKVLSVAAVQFSANPFGKVIDLIKELIARLEEEAQNEAGHKAFCDGELAKNKKKREEKSSEVAAQTAEVDRMTSEVKTLGLQIAALAKAQVDLAKAMKEATEDREKEKAENTQTIADAKAAQEAIASALQVLKEFYAKSSAFLQVNQVPEMAAYKGMHDSATGVVGMIEVIQSDFARLEAETTANEDQAAREYDEFMTDSKADMEAKHKEQFDKEMLKDKKEFELKLAKKDLAATQAELDAALTYYEKLKPQCIEIHVSYEERAARRKEEIEALQEAYRILNGQDSEE